jgi:hypothetical protein
MIEPLNWKIVSHPMNWVVILLMLIIAGAFGHMVLTLFGMNPSTKTSSSYTQLPAGQSPRTAQQIAAVS